MSKINIYVNSKNRKSDESPSNFSVIIPDDLLKIKKDEYFTLSVNSFYRLAATRYEEVALELLRG